MKRFSAEHVAAMHFALGALPATTILEFQPGDSLTMEILERLQTLGREMGCPLSADYALHMKTVLSRPQATAKHVQDMTVVLRERFYDELKRMSCFFVPSEQSKFFDASGLLGETVVNAFPSAVLDIEEAGKCLALDRNTACVMHLSRALEIVLKAVRTSLALPPLPLGKQTSWGEVLRQIWNEIGVRNKTADPLWIGQQKSFFENVHSDLSSVKNAWRNPSMHADRHYDAERAEDVFNMTRSFVRHAAEHLDELGNFNP